MRFTLFLFLIYFASPTIAQVEAPQFFCIKGDSLIYGPKSVNNTCGDFIAFDVFGSQDRTGGYTLLGSITDPDQSAYVHPTPIEEVWYYYMQSNHDCPNEIVLTSDTLDNILPEIAPLISISIENGLPILNWEMSPSAQTFAYVIFREIDGTFVSIDTVGIGTTFLDVFAEPNNQSETYMIAAMDQCGNLSTRSESHRTIFLQTENSACDQVIQLNWNFYDSWTNGIEAQEIWVQKENEPAERVSVMEGNVNNYRFENAENGVNYSFYINAIERNTGANAKSNVSQIAAEVVNPVGDLLVKNVSFTDNNEVEILWEWNENAALNNVEIFRSTDNISFQVVGIPDFTPPLANPATYLVDPIHGNEGKTFYRISTTDNCDTTTLSDYVSTIFLEGAAQPNQENLLTWTPYDSRIGTVNNYSIYKIVDNMATFVDEVAGNTNSFSDLATTAADVNACYYVEADVSITFAQSGIETHISRSNTTCLAQSAKIVMPNAFAPNGENRIFKPTVLFDASIQNYQLVIYNRYGGKIFESTDVNLGWNGQKNGRDVPMGTYTYLVQIEQSNGERLKEGGVLMLLR